MPAPAPQLPPGASPLKQVNQAGAPPPKSKLVACWDDLSTDSSLFTKPNAPAPARYFSEFFCLKPQLKAQKAALARLRSEDLAGAYKNNVSQLFVNAVRILKEADREDVSRSNVIETLIPFLLDVLPRKFDNYSYTVLTLLAGSVDKSDQVFGDLVTAVDLGLQDKLAPLHVRHRLLQFALVFVSTVNQGSLNAYFLRRDLFSTLVSFIADEQTNQFAYESVLLLGLLANFRKSEARNPYGVRIEDFVEEGVMTRIISVVETVCQSSRDAYLALADDTPPSFVASLTSFLASFRITELLTSPFSLPPPPSSSKTPLIPSTPASPTPSSPEKGKAKEEPTEDEPLSNGKTDEAPPADQPAEAAPSAPPAPPVTPKKQTGSSPPPSTPPAQPSTPAASAKPPLKRADGSLRPEEAPFAAMPPDMAVLLLPFYELLNSNKTFGSLVFSETETGETSTLPASLISLSSYVVCHASLSERARLYSRLCLICMLILVEEGEGKLTVEGKEAIRLCRQRHPMLSHSSHPRRPIDGIIDAVVIFLRHNLRKRLDVETYTVALQLLQRVIQQLKAEKLRLERNWVIVWRSVLALASFVVSRIADLRQVSEKVDALISQIFITLCYAAYWAESFLPNPSTQANLYYELLHAEDTLSALSDLLGITSVASPIMPVSAPSSTSSLPIINRRDTPTRATFFTTTLSPTRSSFSSVAGLSPVASLSVGTSGTGGGFIATECISSLRSATTFFSSHINQLRLTKPATDEVDPDEILAVIERNLGGVEMIESAAMGDARRFAVEGSAGMESYFRRLIDVACEDTLRLMEKESPA
ncbi:hypothetical protein JCM10207_008445 [Rhodosporidiobolus poonsookiae]